ncbi:MAG: hypothetical protein ACI82J_001088 [Sulfitobacter litoralis]|jgi:hypothetical protein
MTKEDLRKEASIAEKVGSMFRQFSPKRQCFFEVNPNSKRPPEGDLAVLLGKQ